jgi:hypothetical protein
MVGMQTLGLSSKPQPTDNLFKRLLWPAIESQYDVDLLGQQGFWVCTIIAVMSLVLLVMGTPVIAVVTAIIFFLGGCGVRQRSIPASIFVSLLYLVNFVGGITLGSPGNPLIQTVVVMLLFANVRATVLSQRWITQPVGTGDQELPERLTESFTDRFSNVLPAKLWPVGRYVFFPMVVITLLLTIVGFVAMKKQAGTRKIPTTSTSQQIEISPQ